MPNRPLEYENPGDERDERRFHDLNRDEVLGGTTHGPNSSSLYGVASGTHEGRGPKGHRRSDEAIYEDVCEGLTHAADVDASGIEVLVANGEVTLAGVVQSRYMKRLAEDIALNMRGVADVHNRLDVDENAR